MKRLLIILCLFCATAKAAPVLFFSDLDSGPKTGGENNKGAYIRIYGIGFKATQGSSTVTVGGGLVDHCTSWGTTWLWYQKITCQLGSAVSTGDIVVTVDGSASNGISFTVRSGNIYFASPSGSNSNDGSFATPFKDAYYCKNALSAGDICYLRAGTWSSVDPTGDGANVLSLTDDYGTSGNPKAVIGYPGETATLACNRSGAQCWDIEDSSGTHSPSWWTFAELDLGATPGVEYNIDIGNGAGGDGQRYIGNKIHGASAVATTFQGPMDPFNFLGNDVYDYFSMANGANTNERGYGIYMGGYGTQAHINIEWNRFWNDQPKGTAFTVNISGTAVTWESGDKFYSGMPAIACTPTDLNYPVASVTDSTHLVLSSSGGTQTGLDCYAGGASTKGIQIYGHHADDLFEYVSIANNMLLDNCMEAMEIGGTDGGTDTWTTGLPLYIYNNLVVDDGSCDTIKGFTYSGIQIGDNYMVAKLWNNTFYLNAGGTIGGQNASDIYLVESDTQDFDISNNIFYAQPNGTSSETYHNFVTEDHTNGTDTLNGSNNLFFSNGNTNADSTVYTWVNNTVSTSDPLFVSPAIQTGVGTGFKLQGTSPAINGGESLGSPDTADIQGVSRPQNTTDGLGIYEYPTSSPPVVGTYYPWHK